MAKKVKIKLQDNIARVITLEEGATDGATLGTNLFLPNGTVASPTTLAAYLGLSNSQGIRDHRLLAGLALGDDHPQYTRKDTLTTRGDLYARNATTVARLALGTNKQLLRSNGTDPAWATLSPTITLSTDLSGNTTLTDLENATLAATIVNNAVTDAKLRDSAALSVIGRASNTSGDPADIASSGSLDVLRRSGTAIGFGTIDHTYTSDFDEAAQDAVGNMFVDSSEIDFTYDDAGAHVTASLIAASVAFAKLQNISTSRILGRVSASSGSIESLTGTQATTLLDLFTSSLQGLVPASGGGTANFLCANGTFTAPAGGITGLANPTASVGLTAVNGSAATAMRSDGAPALSQAIAPTWTGNHTFTPASGNTSFTAGQVLFPDGTVSLPGVSFGTDPDSGLYRIGANNLGLTLNGAKVLDILTTGLAVTGAVVASNTFQTNDGSASNPGFAFLDDPNCGAYRISSDLWALVSGAFKSAEVTGSGFNTFGAVVLGDGTNAVTIKDAAGALRLRGTANNQTTNASYLSMQQLGGTENGYIGYGGSSARLDVVNNISNGNVAILAAGTGSVVVFDGTAAHPMYSFINDPDTGLYTSAANVLDVALGGSRAIGFNGATTTGAQTATFIATNKPGSGTAGPIAWLPVLTAGGTQGYIPIFGA